MHASNDMRILVSAPINIILIALKISLILAIVHYPTFCMT